MAVIANLAVVLAARTSAFEKGMSRSRKKLSFVQRQAMATRGAILSMAKGFVLAAGVAGLGLMVKKSFETIDAVAKMSDELQISTQSLSGLSHAAKIYGTSLSSVQKGLQIMVRRLGEANEGYGEGLKGLKAMGVSAQEMIDMGTEKAFLKIADAVKVSQTAAEKANIAYQLFGRGGVEMINLLSAGSKGLLELKTEADKLGISFSRIDAFKIEQANDMLARMRARFTGIAQTVAIQFAPIIEGLGIKFLEMSDHAAFSQKSIINSFRSSAVGASKLFDVLKLFPLAFNKMTVAAGTLQLAYAHVFLPKNYRTQLKAYVLETNKATNRVLANLFKRDSIDKFFDDVEKRAATAAKRMQAALARRPLTSPLVASESQITAGQRLTAQTRSPLEKFKKDIGEYKSLLKIGTITWDTYGRAVQAAQKALETGFNETPIVKMGKRLTESLLTPMEKFKKDIGEINKLFKAGAITRQTFERAIAKGPAGGFPSPATSDFGVLSSPDVSIKGLSIGGKDSGINTLVSQGQTQINLLTVIAAKEEVA